MHLPESSFRRPNRYEQQLVAFLLAGDVAPMPALRAQWPHARVRVRTFDQYGATANLWFPGGIERVEPRDHEYDDIGFRLRGDTLYRNAELHVREGRLHSVEYEMYEAEVEAELELVELGYMDFPDDATRATYGPGRDLQGLEEYLERCRHDGGRE